jgi:hypothetical protein
MAPGCVCGDSHVEQRLDRGAPRRRAQATARELVGHRVLVEVVQFQQTDDAVELERDERLRRHERHVDPGGLHEERGDVLPPQVPERALEGRVAPAVHHEAGLAPRQAGQVREAAEVLAPDRPQLPDEGLLVRRGPWRVHGPCRSRHEARTSAFCRNATLSAIAPPSKTALGEQGAHLARAVRGPLDERLPGEARIHRNEQDEVDLVDERLQKGHG